MKKVLVVFLVLCSSFAMACESNKFNIYYLPLEAEFYIPPSREYIIQHGISFEINSCILTDLFEDIMQQKGTEPQEEDKKGLRILLINETNGLEIFFTTDKAFLSLSKKKKYNIDTKTINKILKELVDYIQSNKLD